MTENRYDVRLEPNGYWAIYDIFTGQPAAVNDTVLDMLELEEADDLVHLLNREYIERRRGQTH